MSIIENSFSGQSFESEKDVIVINGEIFTYKSSGITRKVYANESKTKVVKVCIERGNYFNQEEIDIYTSVSDKSQLAETKLLDNGYIEQEFLHTLDDEETFKLFPNMTNEQIRFARSCRGDVGFDKNGVLKCHDLEEFKKY